MADAGAPENPSSQDIHSPVAKSIREAEASRPTGWARALLVLLGLLPKNAMSRLAGRIASLRLPAPLQRAEIRLFARLVNVDLAEARDPIDHFDSLQSFFTRALREGARPIEGDADCLVAPCDGAWGESGRIDEGTLVQVKGRTYRVSEFLADPELAPDYEGGRFATFYLSPRDYHRFHTPIAGRIERVDYHPGALWPVNAIGLGGIDRLFARNERICAYLSPELSPDLDGATPHPPVALVAVGATMVGSVRLAFDDLRTNVAGAKAERRDYGDRAPAFAKGEEWGHFEFGSTIVMLVPPGAFTIEALPVGRAVRLGEVIGRFRR